MKKCALFLNFIESLIIIIILLFINLHLILALKGFDEGDSIQEPEFYYEPAIFEKSNVNITLGITAPLSKFRGTADFEFITGGILAAICQADKINQKLEPEFNFNGTINLAVIDYEKDDPVGQYSAMKLMENSFYNIQTGRKLNNLGFDNLGGFLGIASSGRNRIDGFISSGFSIPFVNPGTQDQADPTDNYAIISKAENRTFFGVRDTIVYTAFSAILDLMKAYNWTIAANIFQDNVLGLSIQQNIQQYQVKNSSPIFTCNTIITRTEFLGDSYFQNLCQCMGNIQKLSLLLIWASPPLSFGIIKRFKTVCPAAKKFIFIVGSETEPLPKTISDDMDDFKYVLSFRPAAPQNFGTFISDCIDRAQPAAKATMEKLLQDLLWEIFNCVETVDEISKNYPQCPLDVRNRPVPCICTGLELDSQYNSYSFENYFFADAVSIYASIISRLQKDCVEINEKLRLRTDKIVSNLDFCKLKSFNPAILTGLLALTEVIGYTGLISYAQTIINIRLFKSYYLYNIQTTLNDAVLVGFFSAEGYKINFTDVLLPDGNETISKLVPQNANIEYGAVAVFFGIIIFLLCMTLLAMVILFKYFDHPLIRRNTPKINMIMLFGLVFIAVSAIMQAMDVNDAMCWLEQAFYNLGYGIVIGGIIAKEYRIYRIFTNKSASAIVIKDSTLFVIVGGFAFSFSLFTLAYYITGLQAKTLQSKTNPFYLYYECECENMFWTIFLNIFKGVSYLISRLIAVFLAWRTRRVSSSYSESYSITALVGVLIVLSITLYPLFYTLRGGTNTAVLKAVIRLLDVTYTLIAILALLYYNRFYQVWKYEQRKKKSSANNLSTRSVLSETPTDYRQSTLSSLLSTQND